MLDWRIVGASFAALVVASSLFMGSANAGVGDFFSDIMSQINEWMSGSPFGGMFSTTSPATKQISILISPSVLEFSPGPETIIFSGDHNITGFSGTVSADFSSGTAVLASSKSDLKISMPAEISFQNLALGALTVEGARFTIPPNMTIDNGTVTLKNFLGTGSITSEGLELQGNVSTLKATMGDFNWELS